MHVILTHEQADFDAIAAMLGAFLLDDQAFPILPHRMNRNVRAFLALYGSDLPYLEHRELPTGHVSHITLVDTQSLVTLKGVTLRTLVHVVDHHRLRPDLPPEWTTTSDRVGATTTLFIEKIVEQGVDINTIQATLLLLGIYEDTGSLIYSGTTPRDVHAAAYLLERGASLHMASEYLNPALSPEQRRLYDLLLSSAKTQVINGQNIIIACADARGINEEISSVAHKMRDLLDPDALFLLVTTDDGVRLVARSTTDRVNVSEVAARFGGGGHERAAASLIHSDNNLDASSMLSQICQRLTAVLPDFVKPSVTIGQIMSRQPRVLSPQTPAKEAVQLMLRYGYEGYPVVQDKKVVGLLTRRSVDRAISHKLNLTAASLMEAGEVTVQPSHSIEHLQQVMTETGWGQIPVVDPVSNEIIGIVTRTDLLKCLTNGEAHLPGRVNLTNRLEAALPPARLALLRMISAETYGQRLAAYIVGGLVRDLLLERSCLDFDIVIEGDAIALGRHLTNLYGGRIVSHGRFGTAKWWIADIRSQLVKALSISEPIDPADLPESLDLISARTEFYDHPSALPTVERSSIKLDLHRRDFTINTMALRLDGIRFGDLYDFWGGLNDLKAGIIRVLHSLSFVDDPTRMIRAVRFEQRFDFKIDNRTLQLVDEARSLLRQMTGTRIRHELDLVLSEEKAIQMLSRLQSLDLLSVIHPDLVWSSEVASLLDLILNTQPEDFWNLSDPFGHMPLRTTLAYTTWLAPLSPEISMEIINRLRLPAALQTFIQSTRRVWLKLPLLIDMSPSQIVSALEDESLISLYVAGKLVQNHKARDVLRKYVSSWQHIRPYTTGDTLRSLDIKPGPKYRQILRSLRAAWLDGQITTRQEEDKLLMDMIHE